jgi:hypothetical protein
MISLVQLGCVLGLRLVVSGVELILLGKLPSRLGEYQVNELLELLDIQTESARESERFDILETVKSVFGDDVEVIEFIPYGDDK